MYRRPYPYDSSYYFYPPLQNQSYYLNSHHLYNPAYHTIQSHDSPYYQTPFQQFSKPNQVTSWPNGLYEQQQADYTKPPSNFLTQFQNDSGQIDINKTLSTVGQIMHTAQQVSPMIKQFGTIIKSFR